MINSNTGGFLLLAGALSLLYLYNTGRLSAIVGVLKNPNYYGPQSIADASQQSHAGDIFSGAGTGSAQVASSSGHSSNTISTVVGDVQSALGSFSSFTSALGGLGSVFGV